MASISSPDQSHEPTNKPSRVAILTGGGDCPGLNAAIRGVAKTLMLRAQTEIIGIEDGFLGFIERRSRTLTYQDCSGILSLGGTMIGTHNRANPFDYMGEDRSRAVKEYYDELALDALVIIGGDGTLSIGYELTKLGMNIVGVPKTIDNDLMCTERTFGFDTAVSIVTDAIDRLRTTGQSHQRIMIVETMGRNAGWIALHAGIAGGADSILLPEHPYDINLVADACNQRMGTHHFSIVVVAEGAKPINGEVCTRETIKDSPEPTRLGGIGDQLKQQLEQLTDAEIRSTTLGHIQRGGSPTSFDRIFATNLGSYAAGLVINKQFNLAVIQRGNQLSEVPLDSVAHKTRNIPNDDPTLQTALSMGICFGTETLLRSGAKLNEPE
ncbi:MAG: 6-phosphofructokinase [Paraglaciecola chathamensis]|uniref:6-phosphofructokinase n=1 Tax=Paraglaciecola chathamensis TaxID=368405 RepID=UPI0018733707|nr:ATP-dependent 6-phosphofructokinase [Paraglaciecola agarilytica]